MSLTKVTYSMIEGAVTNVLIEMRLFGQRNF